MSREIAIELREQAKGLRDVARELDSKAKSLEKDAENREQEAEAEKNIGVSIARAAADMDVSQETVRRWLKTGRVKGYQLPGGHWRVDAESLHALLQSAEPDPGVIDPHASRSRLVAVQGSLRQRERVA